MMNIGKRLGLPLVSFTALFGAAPTVNAELQGQYREIEECITTQVNYPHLQQGKIIMVSGSGGGMATTLRVDDLAMLSGSQEYVAPPASAASILYKNPTRADIVRTAEGMQPTAQFSLARRIIDRIIEEPENGAQNNPLETVNRIREDIIQTHLRLGHLPTKQLLERRHRRIEELRPIPIGYLDSERRVGVRATIKQLVDRYALRRD